MMNLKWAVWGHPILNGGWTEGALIDRLWSAVKTK